jgi:hypothetical protein
MKITAKMLQKQGACQEQVDLFRKEWPQGAVVNKKNALRAVELGLDIRWVAVKFLKAPAWAEYKKVTAAAWAEYEKVTAPALAEYNKVTAAALAKYEKACALAFVKLAKAG